MAINIRTKNGELRLNTYTVRRLLYSQEIRNALEEVAQPILRRAGAGHVVEVYSGHDRARAVVKTNSDSSARANIENNNLLKAVGK